MNKASCENSTAASSADALTEDYTRAGFGARLGFGRTPALLLVDFAKAYLDPNSPLYAAVENARDAAVVLLHAARDARIPILHTKVAYAPGGVNGGIFFRKIPALQVFEHGSPLGAFTTGLEPGAGELVITKQYASGFYGTSLAATLTAAGIDTVIIAGLTTSGCVRATAVDAIQHGFTPIVVREAVGDRASQPHEVNLFDLDSKYADVVSLSSALHYLERVPKKKKTSG